MQKKDGQINVNMNQEDFNSLAITKLTEIENKVQSLVTKIIGVKAPENDKDWNLIIVNFTQEEFNTLAVNKLAEVEAELVLLIANLTNFNARKENEEEENSGNIFRSNDENENFLALLNRNLERNKEFLYQEKLKVIQEMVEDYANFPGIQLTPDGTLLSGPQNN